MNTRRIIFGIIVPVLGAWFAFPAVAHAANRYWVGGTGNWDASTTTHWSATSGGGGGASVPTLADNVYFNAASNATAYTVTITAEASCANLSVANPASGVLTLAGSSDLSVDGDFELASGMTNSYTGTISFTTSSESYIATNGVTLGSDIDFTGMDGDDDYFYLSDALSTTGDIIAWTGTLDTDGYSVSSRTLYVEDAILELFGSTWTVTGSDGDVFVMESASRDPITSGTVVLSYSGSSGTRVVSFDVNEEYVFSGLNLYVTAGSDEVYIDYESVIRNLDFTGFSGTWSGDDAFVTGDLTLSEGMTNSFEGAITFRDENGFVFYSPYDIEFSPDGERLYSSTMMYIEESMVAGFVRQSGLADPWDSSTASSSYYGAGGAYSFPTGIAFNQDGTRLYVSWWVVFGAYGISQYDLSVPYDIISASEADSTSLSSAPSFSLSFNATGTRFFVVEDNWQIRQYDLSTAWDASTASAGSTYDPGHDGVSAVSFKSDGTKMYVMGNDSVGKGGTVYQYSLSTAWNVTTATYDSVSYEVPFSGQEDSAAGFTFKSDGTYLYVLQHYYDDIFEMPRAQIHQYSLDTAWNVSTAESYGSLGSTTKRITSNGNSFNGEILFYGPNSEWQLQDAFSTSGEVVFDAGELDTNGMSVSSGTFYGGDAMNDGFSTPTLTLGSSTWTVTSSDNTLWYMDGYPITVTENTATVVSNYSGSSGTRAISMGSNANNPSLSITAGSDIVLISAASINDLNFTGFSGTFSSSSGALSIYGSLTLSSGMTNSYTGALTMAATGTGKTITTNGKTLASTVAFDGVGGGWQLSDNLTTTGAVTLTNGTLNDGGVNVSAPSFSSSNANTRSLTKGAGTWTLSGTGTVWDVDTSTNLTLADSGTIKLTNNSSSAKTFAGGGKTYGNYWNATAGTGTVTMTGSNTFSGFTSDAGRTNLFTAGTTQTVGAFSCDGTSGNRTTLGSTSGSRFSLVKSGGGTVTASYVSVSNSAASPSDTWYAENSVNGGNNTGWNFVVVPTEDLHSQGALKFKGNVKVK